jgi:hypothetical protein
MMENAFGVQLNEGERRLVECYRSLAQTLAGNADDLAPYQQRNSLKALAALWQVMNGLDMEPGQIYHVGA